MFSLLGMGSFLACFGIMMRLGHCIGLMQRISIMESQ